MALDSGLTDQLTERASTRTSTRGRVLIGLALMLALAVHLPVLAAPLLHDDYAQRAMVDGQIVPARGMLDLYDYVDDGDRALLLDRGALPWWTSRALTIRFLRPLSSALVWLDCKAFGYGSVGPHAHSLLWWAAAVVTVFALLRTLVPRRAAVLGTLVFAVAPCLADPLLWLANRDVIVATTFGAVGLTFYNRWRDLRRRGDAIAGALAFAAAIFAGEYAVGFAGYVLAIECVRRDAIVRRATGLLPFVAPLTLYTALYLGLHYGAHGTGFYRSPLGDPAAYLAAAPRRAVVLLATGWFGLSDAYAATVPVGALTVACAGAAFAIAVPWRRVVRPRGDEIGRAHV